MDFKVLSSLIRSNPRLRNTLFNYDELIKSFEEDDLDRMFCANQKTGSVLVLIFT